ncbi:metallophosphoesterase [Erysipelotrichaceae bacterium OttesenSCG-928-M19]|nr:metallophosphoesterase [Erysipelotrichaceae bacterium OttesenSCG-928-M19]
MLLLLIIIAVLVLVSYLLRDERLEVNYYRITTNKIKQAFTIIQLSDLHSTSFGKEQRELLTAIKNEQPDLIVMSGDIFEENKPLVNCENLFKKITNLAPTYYVAGNHEYRDNDIERLFKLLEKYNIIRLVDENKQVTIKDNTINIAGLDDEEGNHYWQRSETKLERLNKITYNDNYFSILLSHHPELVSLYKQSNYDLIFCGHAHGGQFRFNKGKKGLFAPQQGLFPKYTKGIYQLNDQVKMLVSGGLVVNRKPRINNRPDLVVITIEGDEELVKKED